MPNENIQDQNDNIEIDDWSKAFAALEGSGQENDQEPEQEQGDATQGDNTPENTGTQTEPEDQGIPAAGMEDWYLRLMWLESLMLSKTQELQDSLKQSSTK